MLKKAMSDIDRFGTIVDQYKDRPFRFAYMRIGIREDAEDIIQDVFVSLFRMYKDGKDVKEIDHYLLHSVSNACSDYFRKCKYEMLPIEDFHSLPNEADMDIYEEYRRVRLLLDDLPREQAEIVRLKCYDGLTFRQIAELCDIPEATAKSRYRYAITHIKDKYNLST